MCKIIFRFLLRGDRAGKSGHKAQSHKVFRDLNSRKLTARKNIKIFLDIVGKSRKYKNDGARKAMLVVFGLLGDSHPLTKQYCKQLLLQLY
ncbi:MAG: tetratricopeptide repeat protein [Hormoscilla sp. GUM202]|nr:tetratricopeptide repeat protein [Hormoscilla sp. GUM202]